MFITLSRFEERERHHEEATSSRETQNLPMMNTHQSHSNSRSQMVSQLSIPGQHDTGQTWFTAHAPKADDPDENRGKNFEGIAYTLRTVGTAVENILFSPRTSTKPYISLRATSCQRSLSRTQITTHLIRTPTNRQLKLSCDSICGRLAPTSRRLHLGDQETFEKRVYPEQAGLVPN